jgi:hypothetical protein
LYKVATPIQGWKGILRSIQTTMANGVQVKVVFIQKRNEKSKWLTILSTDCTLSEQESASFTSKLNHLRRGEHFSRN